MSETDKGEAPEAETIIQRYYAARRKRVVARRTVTLTTILIALVYLFLIWNRIDYFRSYEIPILSAKLNAEATRYLPKLAEEVQAMTERVVPVYLNSFGEALNENEELYVTVLIEEFDKLERYSRLSWEKMEIAIAQMVLDQEQAVKGAVPRRFQWYWHNILY